MCGYKSDRVLEVSYAEFLNIIEGSINFNMKKVKENASFEYYQLVNVFSLGPKVTTFWEV